MTRLQGEPLPRKLVVAALIEVNGEILVTKRRESDSMGGLWELPGGKVAAGEDPRDALARELREEVGVGVTVGAPFDVVYHRYNTFELVMIVFACHIVSGAPRALDVADARFAKRRDLAALEFVPADAPLIARLARAT